MADARFAFAGEVIYWRGPAPFLFLALPPDVAAKIAAMASRVSYGWGCIPVMAEIGGLGFATSLFPRNGAYLLPIKVALRKQLPPLEIGDQLEASLVLAPKA